MTLQDNQQLRALLSLPPIQTNASTAFSKGRNAVRQ